MKLAFLVPHLGPTQMARELIQNLNQACTDMTHIDPVVFYENIAVQSEKLLFMSMNVTGGWNYKGPMIATTAGTAHKMLNFPCPSSKYFYVYDLEWIWIPNRRFNPLSDVYQNTSLELIARSKDHQKILEIAWNRPVKYVIESFNIRQMIEVINATN